MKQTLLALAVFAALGTSAQAATYTNVGQGISGAMVFPVGTLHSTYGESFSVASDSSLLNWSFFSSNNAKGALSFSIASFNGLVAGPVLFTTTVSALGTGQAITASNINLDLSAGSYIAVLAADKSNSPSSLRLKTRIALTDPLHGFAYAGLEGKQGYLPVNVAYTNLAHSAEIVERITVPPVSAVPEPETYAMLLAGMGMVGFIARRRRRA